MYPTLQVNDFAAPARERMTAMAWEYLDSGAGDELTLAENSRAFDRIELLPNVLKDVSQIDTSVSFLEQRYAHPILLAPVAYHKLFHPQGEIETAQGAVWADATLCVSTMSNTTIEEIAKEVPDARLWYQLYVQRDRDYTRELIQRVENAGAKALVITVDTPVLGNRVRETRAGFALPVGLERAMLRDVPEAQKVTGHGTDLDGIYYPLVNPAMTWKDIEWMLGAAKIPVILKGILNPQDAAQAVHVGAHGIIVSNHGARNLDTVPATITMLPEVARAVDDRIPVLFDGGIRRGTDILKALASGATAVLVGRPYIWGLAVSGAAGVNRVVDLLLTELKIAMALCGRAKIPALDRSLLRLPGR